MNSLITSLIKLLKEKNLTLALAESVTAGLAAHKLCNCPGVAEVFKGAIISYTPELKNELLGVSKKMIKTFSCESKEVTQQMAKSLSKIIKSNVSAAVTGLASSGGSESSAKPVGTVFLSVVYNKHIYDRRKLFYGSPLEIKNKACMALYELITETIVAKN